MSQLSKKGPLTLLVLIAGVVIIAMVFALKPKPKQNPPRTVISPPVEVLVAVPMNERLSIHSQGTVLPKREIDLVSQVAGKVIAVADHYADGEFFEEGEMLVQIEPDDYRFAVLRAEAQVARAKEQLALERGRARQAKREWRDLGDANANALFLREPQIASAEAALASSEADLQKAQLDLRRTTVSAPFRGRIRDTLVDLGQYVAPGSKIAKVYSTDVVEIRLPLNDRQAALIDLPVNFENGEPTIKPEVTLYTGNGRHAYRWQGTVVRTEASIDVQSRMVVAVAEVQHPFRTDPEQQRPPLSIGMFVEAEIDGKRLAEATEIPLTALYRGSQILVLNENDEIYFQDVELLQAKRKSAVVAGISPGTRVAASRLSLPIEGMKVAASDRPLESPEVAAEADSEPRE